MKTQHAVDELIQNYKDKDLIKAKAIIDFLPELEADEKRRLFFEVSRFEDPFRFSVLGYCLYRDPEFAEHNDELTRLFEERAQEQPRLVLRKLVKIEPETAVYVRIAGKIGVKEAIPRIRQFLTETSDQALLQASLETLGLVKDLNSIDGISEFLLSKERGLQVSAVKALGNMDCAKSHKLMISAVAKVPELFDLFVSSLRDLPNDSIVHLLSYCLRSADAKIRTDSKELLTKLGSRSVPVLVENLKESQLDLQIHTLNVLSEIGDGSAVKDIRSLLNSKPEDANVRFAAFEALANLPGLKGDYVLATGLSDSDDSIRLAAARAVENALEPTLLGGVKNMISEEGPESLRMIKAIIDAPSRELFLSLIEAPYFKKIAVEYIGGKVHHDVREHYLNLLSETQQSELSEAILGKTVPQSDSDQVKPIICAVDDSVMILSIYRRVLNELGYDPILFQYPDECLEWLKQNQPEVLFTDLNMPGMTGVELTRKVRDLYKPASLPIVMVTTQQEGLNSEELRENGISDILSKPFDTNSIKAVLNQFNTRND